MPALKSTTKTNMENWIDITTPIENGMVHWPGDIPVSVQQSSSLANGDEANVTTLSMSAHTATHIDAPRHFIANGKDITQIPLEILTGPAKVFHIQDPHSITLKEIKDFPITAGDRLLFRTCNSDKAWAMQEFQQTYVYLATDAAEFLQARGIVCVGTDYLSIAGEENEAEVHKLLLGSDICIIEGLNLNHIEAGNYEMVCLPLKIKWADGAPARVIIRKI